MDHHYLPRGVKMVGGDPLRDEPDLRDSETLLRALSRLVQAGVTLPKALQLEHARLKQSADVAAALPFVASELARVFAEEAAAAAQAQRERTVTFPWAPSDPTDVLVIGESLDHYPGGESSEQEIGGKTYRFRSSQMIHFVPAAVKEAWTDPRGLPGQVCGSWPSDLLRVYRQRFTRLKAGGRQGTGPAFSEIEVDEEGLVAAASAVVRGCLYQPLLDTWLATARTATDQPNQVLAKVIEQRLTELAGAEVAA